MTATNGVRRSEDILIIGGGFAGLLMASRMPGSLVFEENPRVGVPPHCTGLVSERTVALIGSPARESVTSRYRVIRVMRLRGGEVLNLIPDQAIVRLDRILLEEILAKEAEDLGSKIYTRARVLEISGKNVVVNRGSGLQSYSGSLIVVAEGSQQRFSRSLGLAEEPEFFVGVQGFARVSEGIDQEEIYVFVDDNMFKGFFGWLIPLGSKKAVVGMATRLKDPVYGKLRLFLKILGKRGFLADSNINRIYGGLVIRGNPLENHHAGSVIAIGDASNFTKPFSGGGLYPSSLQIGLLASRLKRHDPREALTKYSTDIKPYVKSLRRQLLLTKIMEKLGVENTLLNLVKLGILKNTETFNYDHHDEGIYRKLKKLPEALSRY